MSKSVAEKLGFKSGMRAVAHAIPADLKSEIPWPEPNEEPPDLLLIFVAHQAAMTEAVELAARLYARGKHLWIAYPKLSGKLKSDLSRDRGWEPIAAHDLHGVMQVSLSEDWSALRFRYRDEIKEFTRKF
jgi:hypothetical protein